MLAGGLSAPKTPCRLAGCFLWDDLSSPLFWRLHYEQSAPAEKDGIDLSSRSYSTGGVDLCSRK